MPWVRLMPTGGVAPEKESISAWVQAGVACIGLGSKFISNKLIEVRDFPAITASVKQTLDWILEARKGVSPI